MTKKCATCPRIIALSERQKGRIRCRWCRKAKPGDVLQRIQKRKTTKGAGIALVTRAMKKQPTEARVSFWCSAPRENWKAQVEGHKFPAVPHGPILCSWTRDY